VFPIATYSLPAAKSTAVTCPRGVLDVGQLGNTVKLGRWTFRTKRYIVSSGFHHKEGWKSFSSRLSAKRKQNKKAKAK
jgi:hypothetical protein